MLILALEQAQYTWTTLAVLAVRPTSLTALEALLSGALEVISMMLEYGVKVWRNDFGIIQSCLSYGCNCTYPDALAWLQQAVGLVGFWPNHFFAD